MMKKWLTAAAAAVILWTAPAAQGADISLPGGAALPMDGTEAEAASSSFLGGLLAEKAVGAASEEHLAHAADDLGLFGAGQEAERDELAAIIASIARRSEARRLIGGSGEAYLFSVYVTDEELRRAEALFAEAARPDLSGMERDGHAAAGKFSLLRASPMERGVSSGGVPYRTASAALSFDGGMLRLPFRAAFAVLRGGRGETYSVLLVMEGADAAYFLPRFEKGLTEAFVPPAAQVRAGRSGREDV